ncbi:MAG: hypothetical protein FIA97_05110 [Methylococcaceae bacterium]|nr:hypothetical protein [Methylococcaceae bacterium]
MIKKTLKFARYPLLSGFALLFGFARELTVSSHFGLSQELDVYVAVLGFYTFFGVQIGNVLEMVFISKSASFSTPEAVNVQLAKAVMVLLLMNGLVAGILFGGGGHMLQRIFPNFTQQQQDLGAAMLGYLFLAIVFANLSGLYRAALNVLRVFAPGMLGGSIISLCSIAAVLLFSQDLGIQALLFGFLVGNSLVLLLVIAVMVRHSGRSFWTAWKNWRREHSIVLWRPALIVLFGELSYQGYTLTERSFASDFGTGTISAFFYAWALVNIPVALVVMPVSNVAYPQLAQTFANAPRQGLKLLYRHGGMLLGYGVLIAICLSLFSDWIVRTVFMRGKFTADDALLTSQILAALVFVLPFMCFSRIVRYSLYSLSNYLAPTLALFLGWALMTGLATLLSPRYGIRGLAYASVISISAEPLAMLLSLVLSVRSQPPEPVQVLATASRKS